MDSNLERSIGLNGYLVKGYDRKLLDKLAKDLEFNRFFKAEHPPFTEEEKRRFRIRDKWYARRIARVRKIMEAYHISGSELCDCDY